uniref:Centriolar coiled-coil protein 110 n=1 Tax=Amphiprion percula TaxID=161767 RepID=A0A3P8T5B9_AMPPE
MMEDYDKFVQHRLSQLRKNKKEERRPSSASSFIRFYGRPILPPLLSGKQREEMQRHRDEAQKAAIHRKLKDDPRMAYVQTILHSVQLRKTPTLEELLQESENNTRVSLSHDISSGSVSQTNSFVGTKDSLSPLTVGKVKDGISLPLLTSTMYSAFFASNVTSQQVFHDRCLNDQLDSRQGSQPSSFNGESHHSLSSGYVTYENVGNTMTLGKIGNSEEVYNMGGFFLHNTSDTIAKMPDIISHPPIDGEELERSGLELSICNTLTDVKDNCCTSIQEDSVTCDHLSAEKPQSSHLDSVEHEDNMPFKEILDSDKDEIVDRNERSVPLLEKSGFSDIPSQALSTRHCPAAELHIQHDSSEAEPADTQVDETDSQPSEEPYRLSLQALLKKSQEYRRRQRMLRNQAKNTKIQERTQEQPRARAEEQSLSDKENDEFLYKGTVTTEAKKTKERKGTFIQSVETSLKKPWEREMIENDFTGKRTNVKSESAHLTEDVNTMVRSVEEETTLKNNKLNISQEVTTKPKPISAFTQQQPTSAGTSPLQDAFHVTTCPTAFYNGLGKYHTVPAPTFCRSPIHCKTKGSPKDGAVVDEETSEGKFLSLNDDQKVEEANLGQQNTHSAVPSTVNVMVEGDVTNVLAKSSQHIDQLESNLSSLKVLISDLESTVKENLDSHSQTVSKAQSELSFKGVNLSEQIEHYQQKQLGQNDGDYWEDKQRDDGERKDWEFPRRQSFDNCKTTHEHSGSEPITSDTDDVPVTVQENLPETVHFSELRLIKTSATEREEGNEAGKERLTKSNTQHSGCRKQTPPGKCIFSVAQWMRIPDVFRNAPPESTAAFDASVLSDASNHLVQRRIEMAVEGHDSVNSPSLNQSYDVDRPSGLWFLEGSGSDLGSQGRLVQENNLTPESEGEGQGGMSKVKRRLLMHMTEDTQERSTDNIGEADSVVRPNSSTPRAAMHCYDKQEQLKQVHAAQVRALQEEHRKQQEELLQALAVRYRLLQSVSFPCSMSSSRLGDMSTFLSQPSSPLSQCYRPLLSAAVKGFLTRRLLRTERVAQLVRTIRDTQQFLQAFGKQSPSRGELCSKQDLLLQERVTLQLRAARYEVYDVFFSLSARERMQLISWDRELARERELRRQSGNTGHPRGKSSLSAATQKSLERKRGIIIQKKAAERHRGVVTRTGQKSLVSEEQPLETKRGQFRANPQRVPKSTFSSRPR